MATLNKSAKANVKKQGYSTLAVHGGEDRLKYADSVTVPIVQTSTFIFKDEIDIAEYTSGKKKRFEYARYGNPTVRTAELKLAALEGAVVIVLRAHYTMDVLGAIVAAFCAAGLAGQICMAAGL